MVAVSAEERALLTQLGSVMPGSDDEAALLTDLADHKLAQVRHRALGRHHDLRV